MTDTLDPHTVPSRKAVRSEAKLLLSRSEAAELLSISQRAFDYLIASRMLPTRRIGTRVLNSATGSSKIRSRRPSAALSRLRLSYDQIKSYI
jgi:hypothetical protein